LCAEQQLRVAVLHIHAGVQRMERPLAGLHGIVMRGARSPSVLAGLPAEAASNRYCAFRPGAARASAVDAAAWRAKTAPRGPELVNAAPSGSQTLAIPNDRRDRSNTPLGLLQHRPDKLLRPRWRVGIAPANLSPNLYSRLHSRKKTGAYFFTHDGQRSARGLCCGPPHAD
jgi:hypothetical protein